MAVGKSTVDSPQLRVQQERLRKQDNLPVLTDDALNYAVKQSLSALCLLNNPGDKELLCFAGSAEAHADSRILSTEFSTR